MRRNIAFAAGLMLFVEAWFLPVHQYGKTLPDALPGWEACLTALSPAWETVNPAQWYGAALSVASALTNLLVVILVFAWRSRGKNVIPVMGCACMIAFGLNAQWFLDHRAGLRIGYYLWWLSFGVLGLACLLPSRSSRPEHGRCPTANR